MAKPDAAAAVGARLHDAAFALLAIHNLAKEAHDSNAEWYLIAIEELAKATFKGVDACRERLTGEVIGNFRDELE